MEVYIVTLLCIFGLVQVATPASPNAASDLAYMEDLRGASRIVAGTEAEDGEFPYTVSLRMVGPWGGVGACGGSILTTQWILTAAHCLARRFTWVVRYGVTNVTRPDYILESTDAYIHHGYDQVSTAVQTDDIGLLRVENDIPYGAHVQQMRIQSSQRKYVEYPGVQLTISGFGRTNDAWLGGLVSEVLYWIHQRGISQAECLTWYVNSQVISAQTMCTQFYHTQAENPCAGDSGGPLTMVDEDGQLTQVGIMSFGAAVGCNTPNPSGYVRPEHYHDWIEEQTGISFDWNVEDLKKTK